MTPPVLFLSPVGLDRRSWVRVAVPPVRAIHHEFPGFGGRPREPAQVGMRAWMADLAHMLEFTAGGPVHIVGCSLGAMVAQNLAVSRPELVASLVLACSGASGNPDLMRARAERTEEVGMEGVLAETLERWFMPQTLSAQPEPEGVSYARTTLLALEPSAFADGWRVIAEHDVRDSLGQLEIPVTCVGAAADQAAPPSRVREMADAMPGARTVTIPGAHMAYLEHGEAFGRLIAAHLEAVIG